MNGRLYDPVMGHMFSADNYVQPPYRYTYAFNNPLKYTDPDGEWVHFVVGAVVGGIDGAIVGSQNGAKGWDMFAYIVA